jgi:small subunit ribosomal protein S5
MKIRLQRETREQREKRADQKDRERESTIEAWVPKTRLGKLVKEGQIQSYDEIIKKNLSVLEPEIVDVLIPELKDQVMEVRKTTKVTRSGRNFRFRVGVIVGDGKGLIGIGNAKDRERWPAARKAIKNAKLNLISIRRGCGSWECQCGLGHTVPFAVEGKSASVRVKLMPAPKGTGLVAGDSIKPVLKFVGVEDVWSSSQGNTATKLNFVKAAIDALSKTTKMKLSKDIEKKIKARSRE